MILCFGVQAAQNAQVSSLSNMKKNHKKVAMKGCDALVLSAYSYHTIHTK